MAIALKRTGGISNAFIKMLVYGESGAGKTTLVPTLPNVIAISAEGGFLSIADSDIPYIEVSTIEDLEEAYDFVTNSKEAQAFESVALDSISEVAEVVLSNEKGNSKDGRAAYGEMNDKMAKVIRAFRDIPDRHVYFSAKMDKTKDEEERIIYAPSMPGKKLTQDLPYYFDEVFALRVGEDDGKVTRMLQTQPEGRYIAKDRSGKLSQWCEPHLGGIIETIRGAEVKS